MRSQFVGRTVRVKTGEPSKWGPAKCVREDFRGKLMLIWPGRPVPLWFKPSEIELV